MASMDLKVEIVVTFTWWGRGRVHLLAGLMRIGLVEPTVARVEAMADWLLRNGAMRVEVADE
jgi:hypothetical protein